MVLSIIFRDELLGISKSTGFVLVAGLVSQVKPIIVNALIGDDGSGECNWRGNRRNNLGQGSAAPVMSCYFENYLRG